MKIKLALTFHKILHQRMEICEKFINTNAHIQLLNNNNKYAFLRRNVTFTIKANRKHFKNGKIWSEYRTVLVKT